MKQIINTDCAPKAIGPYHQAILIGNTLYLSGQIALVPQTGELAGIDIKVQTRQCLANIDAILNSAGFEKNDIVKTVIYLTDIQDFTECNEVYETFFKNCIAPARTTVAVATLPKNAKIEIEVTAIKI